MHKMISLSNGKRYSFLKEIFLYGVIGGGSALTDSGFYFFFTRYFMMNTFLSNFISVNIGITMSFLLNTFINFKQTSKLLNRAVSFYAVGYAGLALSTWLLYMGVHVWGLGDLTVKLSSIVVVAAFQFVLNKCITYGAIK